MIPCRSQSWIKAAIYKGLRSIICRYSLIHWSCKPNKSEKQQKLESSLDSPMFRWNFPKNGRVSLKNPWCWLLDLLQALPASTSSKCHAPVDQSFWIKCRLQGLTCSQLLWCYLAASAHWRDRSFKSESGSVASDLQQKKPRDADAIEVLDPKARADFRPCRLCHFGICLLQPWFAGCCSWYELLLESQVLKKIQKWWLEIFVLLEDTVYGSFLHKTSLSRVLYWRKVLSTQFDFSQCCNSPLGHTLFPWKAKLCSCEWSGREDLLSERQARTRSISNCTRLQHWSSVIRLE